MKFLTILFVLIFGGCKESRKFVQANPSDAPIISTPILPVSTMWVFQELKWINEACQKLLDNVSQQKTIWVRMHVLNKKIDKNRLSLSVDTFKVKCKDLFLK